jgi:hypothetical protein
VIEEYQLGQAGVQSSGQLLKIDVVPCILSMSIGPCETTGHDDADICFNVDHSCVQRPPVAFRILKVVLENDRRQKHGMKPKAWGGTNVFDDPRPLVWPSAMNESLRETLMWIVGEGQHVVAGVLRLRDLQSETWQISITRIPWQDWGLVLTKSIKFRRLIAGVTEIAGESSIIVKGCF